METTIRIPILRTPRLVLRAFNAADWDAFAAMEANPAVRQHRGGNVLTPEQAWTSMQLLLGQWALRGYGVFAIEAAGDDPSRRSFAGFAGVLHPADWPEAELAYSLDEPWWGQGLAIEAAGAVRDWAFERLAVARLVSFIAPANQRSARVARKLGAVRDGIGILRGFAVERWVYPRPGAGVVV